MLCLHFIWCIVFPNSLCVLFTHPCRISPVRGISLLILSQHSSTATTGMQSILIVMSVSHLNLERYRSQLLLRAAAEPEAQSLYA